MRKRSAYTPEEAARRSVKKTSLDPIEEIQTEETQTTSASQPAMAAARSLQQPSSSNTSTAMKAGGSAMMASGNPYAMAAGAGLMTVGGVMDKKQAEKMAEYNAEVDRLNREQQAYGMLSQMAQRFKSY